MDTSDRQQRLVIAAALCALVLAVVYLLFLRGGDAPQDSDPSVSSAATQTQETTESFEAAPETGERAPVETYQVFASRDPFEPVVENGSKGEGVDPAEVMGDNPIVQPDDQPRANSNEFEGHAVTLVDVFSQEGKKMAQVEIDAGGYDVAVGQVFAENFQLVSTSGDCATLLYGDDQFTLCEGEEILK